jgi:uncharacterized protein Usg
MPLSLVEPVKARILKCHRVTAEITYHLPDHPRLLQNLYWQVDDYVPELLFLNRFLRFWEEKLDGKVHSVRVAVAGLVSPTDLKYYKDRYIIN